MDSFYETHLIIDGALEETNTFADTKFGRQSMETWMLLISADARNHTDQMWEVFRLFHAHPPVGDCECFQYVTDHSPIAVYNFETATV